jgi:hypothetical protein
VTGSTSQRPRRLHSALVLAALLLASGALVAASLAFACNLVF